jgi:RHH-type transcriptional regulator, rel operon repressor / antitoxin RelB
MVTAKKLSMLSVRYTYSFMQYTVAKGDRHMPTRPLSVRVDDVLNQQLDALAEATSRSKTYHIYQALQRYVDEQAWQIAHVRAGLEDLAAGRVSAHEDVVQRHIGKGSMTRADYDEEVAAAEREFEQERAESRHSWQLSRRTRSGGPCGLLHTACRTGRRRARRAATNRLDRALDALSGAGVLEKCPAHGKSSCAVGPTSPSIPSMRP